MVRISLHIFKKVSIYGEIKSFEQQKISIDNIEMKRVIVPKFE